MSQEIDTFITSQFLDADASLDVDNPTTNIGTDTRIRAGAVPSAGTEGRWRGVLKGTVPSSPVPGGTIIKVEIGLKSLTVGPGRWVSVHELNNFETRNFAGAQTTWNISQTGLDWNLAGGDFAATLLDSKEITSTITRYWFDITDSITDWDDPFYIIFKAKESLEGTMLETNFDSSDSVTVVDRPQLRITYDDPAPSRVTEELQLDSDGAEEEVTLDWTSYIGPSDVAGYYIYRSASQFSDISGASLVFTVAAPLIKNWEDTVPSDGDVYWYAVLPYDDNGNFHDDFLEPKVITANYKPKRVVDLTVTNENDADQINIDWSTYEYETSGSTYSVEGYEIYRRTSYFSNLNDASLVGTVTDKDTKTWDDTTAVDGTEYWYAVVPYKNATFKWKYEDNLTTKKVTADYSPPRVGAFDLENNRDSNKIELDWGDYVAPSDIADYRIYYSKTGAFSDTTDTGVIFLKVATLKTTTIGTAVLTDNEDVWVAVLPRDSNGHYYTDNLNSQKITTDWAPIRVQALDVVNDRDDNQVSINWATYNVPVIVGAVDGYKIYRNTSNDFTDISGATLVKTITDPAVKWWDNTSSDPSFPVADATKYFYAIVPYDSDGFQYDDNLITESVDTDFSPVRVQDFEIENINDEDAVELDWSTYAQDSDVDGYFIYRKKDSNFTTTAEATLVKDETNPIIKTWKDLTADNDSEYYYAVVPYDTDGNYHNDQLNTQKVDTDFSPRRVTELEAENSETLNGVELDWSAYPKPSDTDGYYIYRRKSFNFTDIADATLVHTETDESVMWWTDTTADNHETYFYAIVPYDNNNHFHSDNLQTAEVDTDFNPEIPTVEVYDRTSTWIEFIWEEISADVVQFYVASKFDSDPAFITEDNDWDINFANDADMRLLLESTDGQDITFVSADKVEIQSSVSDESGFIPIRRKFHSWKLKDFTWDFTGEVSSACYLRLGQFDNYGIEDGGTDGLLIRIYFHGTSPTIFIKQESGSWISVASWSENLLGSPVTIAIVKSGDNLQITVNATLRVNATQTFIDGSYGRLRTWIDTTDNGIPFDIANIEIGGQLFYGFVDNDIVSQTDIHEYDPTQDTYPDGRIKDYKVWAEDVDGHLSSEAELLDISTKVPIQPVTCTAIPWYDTEYGQVKVTWDWTDVITLEEDFEQWDIVTEIENSDIPDFDSTIEASVTTYTTKQAIITTPKHFDYITLGVVGIDRGGLKRFSAGGP